MGAVVKNSKELNLDVRNILARSHTKHWWGMLLSFDMLFE
jgi:hypothetical protein